MKKITILLALTALVLASSCRKVVEFNGSQTDALPVLICQPEVGSPVALRLSYSNFFLREANFPVINNATIHADLNGTPDAAAFSYTEKGIYLSDLILRPDDTLTLRISVPDEGELTAGCRMPAPPVVSDLVITNEFTLHASPSYDNRYDTLFYIHNSDNRLDFQFTLHDPANIDNYYRVCAYIIDSNNVRQSINIKIDDNVLFDQDPTSDYFDLDMQVDFSQGSQVIFSADRINGHNHVIKGYSYDVTNHYFRRGSKLYLEVSSLSRDNYLYHVTRRNQQQNSDILSIINEPVRIHSNVEGGIGILGACAPILVEFPLGI